MKRSIKARCRRHIQQGAAWLDKHVPGWEARVDTDQLDIRDGWRCVAGQVFEREAQLTHSTNGYSFMGGLLTGEGRSHVLSMAEMGMLESDVSADELTEEWREFIKERQLVSA